MSYRRVPENGSSQGQNMAMTALCVQNSLDGGMGGLLKLGKDKAACKVRPILVGTPEKTKNLKLLRTFTQLDEFVPGFPLNGRS
jgi:hypothetical protein